MNEDHKHSDIAEVWDFLFDFFVCVQFWCTNKNVYVLESIIEGKEELFPKMLLNMEYKKKIFSKGVVLAFSCLKLTLPYKQLIT